MERDEKDIWETRDGREIPLDEMYFTHIGAAKSKISRWLKGESDPNVRKDLLSWRKRFSKELAKRQKEWEARNARERD